MVALLFSFFLPGLGQFYNGDFKKGILILALALVTASFIFPYIPVLLWGLVNAYNVAAGKTPLWA